MCVNKEKDKYRVIDLEINTIKFEVLSLLLEYPLVSNTKLQKSYPLLNIQVAIIDLDNPSFCCLYIKYLDNSSTREYL